MTDVLRLEALQAWFVAVTTHPDGVHAGARSASRRVETRGQRVRDAVLPGPHLSAHERLQIHSEGYFSRLEECLADDYPALRNLLGESTFGRLCRAYVAERSFAHRNLNLFGAGMAQHCATQEASWAPLARDVARLEWALVEAVHAELAPPLAACDLANLGAAEWPRVRLIPSATLRVLRFDHAVNRYYQAFRDGDEGTRPERQETACAVHRRELTLWRTDLPLNAAALLEALCAGARLGEALAQLQESTEAAGEATAVLQALPRWLGEWFASGFFRAVERE